MREVRKNMPKEMFERGLAKRKEVMGTEYVDQAFASADDFNRGFQEYVTEACWGFVWGDETLDAKTRSLMNLTMLAALNRMEEWELHFNGAINNGVTRDELRAALHQIAAYCGAPAGVSCFRIAKKVLAELDAA